MKRKSILLLMGLAAVSMLLTACAKPDAGKPDGMETSGGAYQKIDAAEAKRMIDAGGVTVVDVRRADEYEDGHVPGAINIPNEDIADQMPAALPDAGTTLIVYCRSGVRSKQASDKLVRMGYRRVYDMGGILDWTYDTVTGVEPGANAAE